METRILVVKHNCIVTHLEKELFEKEETFVMMKRN